MEKVCKICKKGFISSNNRSIRCPKCQKSYRKRYKRENEKQRYIKNHPKYWERKHRMVRRKECIGGYKLTLGGLPRGKKNPKRYWEKRDKKGNIIYDNKENPVYEDRHTLTADNQTYCSVSKKGYDNKNWVVPTKERVIEWEKKLKDLKSYKEPEDADKEFLKKYLKNCNKKVSKKDFQIFIKYCDAKGRKKIKGLYKCCGLTLSLTEEEAEKVLEEVF